LPEYSLREGNAAVVCLFLEPLPDERMLPELFAEELGKCFRSSVVVGRTKSSSGHYQSGNLPEPMELRHDVVHLVADHGMADDPEAELPTALG
jgi:hypothetical protein